MASLPVLEAVCVCSNSDNVLNLNHKNVCSNGAFSLSLFVYGYVRARMSVSVCVKAQDWYL